MLCVGTQPGGSASSTSGRAAKPRCPGRARAPEKQIRTGQIFGEPTKVDGFSTSRPGALNACPQRQYIPTVQRNPVGAMHSDGVFMSLPKLQCRMHRPYPDTPKPQKNFYALRAKKGKREK